MRFFILILFVAGVFKTRSQTIISTDSIGNSTGSQTVYNKPMFSDSLSSSFCITIKTEVKSHLHRFHSEQVMVIEGEGEMKLGEQSFKIKKGDLVFIPKGSVHSVKRTGPKPLKVLSVQSPRFDGSDRVFVEK